MVSKASTTAVAAITKEASAICQAKLAHNVWATPSRDSPNAKSLLDGAIQRQSVTPDEFERKYTHLNKDKIGVYKRPEHNAKASFGCHRWMSPWQSQQMRHRIARIYMPQRKHVHCHPTNKIMNKYWCIEMDNWGSYKSPLMGWTTGTQDPFNNLHMKFAKLQDAVTFCETNGWGYDVLYPQGQRRHAKKSFVDNFMWKGPAKPEEAYD